MIHKKDCLILADDDEDDRLFFSMAKDVVGDHIGLLTFNCCVDLIKYMDKGSLVPGMVFLDINMPKLSGLECLKEIRNSNSWKDVPVVMYSTSNNEQDITTARELGAQAYIVKPYKIKVLAEMIKWVVNVDWESTVLPINQFIVHEWTWVKGN